MAEITIARRYARALLNLSLEESNQDAVLQDMKSFQAVLAANSGELGTLLHHPGLETQERQQVLELLLSRMSLQPTVERFLRLVMDKRRAALLPLMISELERMADEHAGRLKGSVTSATPLSAEALQSLQSALSLRTGKQVILETRADEELIAGVVIQLGDQVFDGSLRAQLNRLREQLLAS